MAGDIDSVGTSLFSTDASTAGNCAIVRSAYDNNAIAEGIALCMVQLGSFVFSNLPSAL